MSVKKLMSNQLDRECQNLYKLIKKKKHFDFIAKDGSVIRYSKPIKKFNTVIFERTHMLNDKFKSTISDDIDSLMIDIIKGEFKNFKLEDLK